MRREILILLCVVLLGIGAAECAAVLSAQEPPRTVAWWSLIFERPNPEQLPVRVHFQWAKGLE